MFLYQDGKLISWSWWQLQFESTKGPVCKAMSRRWGIILLAITAFQECQMGHAIVLVRYNVMVVVHFSKQWGPMSLSVCLLTHVADLHLDRTSFLRFGQKVHSRQSEHHGRLAQLSGLSNWNRVVVSFRVFNRICQKWIGRWSTFSHASQQEDSNLHLSSSYFHGLEEGRPSPSMDHLDVYAFFPFVLMWSYQLVMTSIGLRMILMVPCWCHAEWYFDQSHMCQFCCTLGNLDLQAWRLSNNSSERWLFSKDWESYYPVSEVLLPSLLGEVVIFL